MQATNVYMTTKEQQAVYRESLFRHLDGIVTAPTAYRLHKKGVTAYLLKHKKVSLTTLVSHFNANEGYLNVALHILCSQGWLIQKIDAIKDEISYETNAKSAIAFSLFETYKDVVYLQELSEDYRFKRFEVTPFIVLEKIVTQHKNNYGFSISEGDETTRIQEQILNHIEGTILGPTLVHLAMHGMFHKYFMQANFKPEEFHTNGTNFRKLLDILTQYEFFKKKNTTFQFTKKGLFFAKRASAYGVTVSYIPTLRKLDELIFGDPLAAKKAGDGSKEGHVDRAMNVWGSGGAHTTYFKVVDTIIIAIFNRPLAQQPKGVLDMGCGNGAFLAHLFDVIEKQTLRGQHLEEYPLILVGADYNEAALEITRKNLSQADIWAKIMWGDIGDPERLAQDLLENYEVSLDSLLNVRSFLDHNRVWQEPKNIDKTSLSASTGAFAFEGKRIPNHIVEASLKQHFKNWAPYVKQFGLLVIELHSIDPELAANNMGRTAVTAYNATHGYSDQYILEADVFHKILESSGLKRDQALSQKFPNSNLATVTVNLFRQ